MTTQTSQLAAHRRIINPRHHLLIRLLMVDLLAAADFLGTSANDALGDAVRAIPFASVGLVLLRIAEALEAGGACALLTAVLLGGGVRGDDGVLLHVAEA